MTTRIPFDIREIPFSTRGAWMDVSPVIGLHRIVDDLHLVSHRTRMTAVLRLEARSAAGERLSPSADSSVLTWSGDGARVQALFDGPDVLRFAGTGSELTLTDAASELTPFTGTFLYEDPVSGAFTFTSYETGRRYRVTVLAGDVRATGSEQLGAGERSLTISGDRWEIAVEEFATAAPPLELGTGFDEALEEADDRFEAYLDAIAGWRDDRAPAAALAAYVLWSATVAPAGFLGREAILMSKHWMDKLWSWDHCFNALALAEGAPEEALGQFLLPFDHQTPEGALPDSIAHSEVLYNYVKPPIHGWAFARMRSSLEPLTTEKLREVHDRLASWSLFWLDHRTAPGRVAPYYQHGNDSGWDNSTSFDRDRVVESPDLAAFLLLQLEVVAGLADELGLPSSAWRESRCVLAEELRGMWDGTALAGRSPLHGRTATTTSLLNLLPLLAAEELTDEMIATMLESLAPHLTEWGPATEAPSSPHYEPDGYWRGPIWAPSTFLLVDGLRRAGRDDLADDVSARFRRLCERGGFAENFDALTGEGLRDRAYTWTASVYLLLARESPAPAGSAE